LPFGMGAKGTGEHHREPFSAPLTMPSWASDMTGSCCLRVFVGCLWVGDRLLGEFSVSPFSRPRYCVPAKSLGIYWDPLCRVFVLSGLFMSLLVGQLRRSFWFLTRIAAIATYHPVRVLFPTGVMVLHMAGSVALVHPGFEVSLPGPPWQTVLMSR
jgi:hypothetical protein